MTCHYISGSKISKRLLQWKVHVKQFSHVKTQCMKDLKPSLCPNPSHFILRIGINNLKSENSSISIAKKMTDITVSFKSEVHCQRLYIRVCTNNQQLNQKALKVNSCLADFHKEINFS